MRKKIKHCRWIIICALLGTLGVANYAVAIPITFTATGTDPEGGNLAASATFDTVGTDLIVTLTNTYLGDVMRPTNVLTALFFTIDGNPTLTRLSALLGAGSSVLFDTPPSGGNVGGEWAYKRSLQSGSTKAPGGADQGISSVGLNLFGPPNRFPGPNLQGPPSPDGLQYGITSAGDNPTIGNAAVTGNHALIKNSVVFKLDGLPSGFNPSAADKITKVSFQYGTSLSGPNLPGTPSNGGGNPGGGIPEPGILGLFGIGLLGMGLAQRRRSGYGI